MSYVLDALRRADAERERGSVPGIHAQPAMLGEADAEAPRAGRAGLRWVAAALLVLALLAAGAWWLLGRDAPSIAGVPSAQPPVPVTSAAPMPLTPAPAPVPLTPAPAPASVQAPVAATPLVAAVPPAPVPAAAPAAATPRASEPRRPASAPAATEPRIYQLSELPDEIRRELPALAIGGAMYSQNPANRMLIVNGQTFHEGDKLAPNLSLEQIRLKSAVLDYKGYRYGITY